MKIITLCLIALWLIDPAVADAQSLNVRIENGQLRLLAPELRFVRGETLQQLQNGASVTYVFNASITTDQSTVPIAQTTFRFVMSYDLWEERYAVRRLEPMPRSASNLSVMQAEAWCLTSLLLPIDRLSPNQAFFVSLAYRVEELPSSSTSAESQSSLGRLVDIFSRRSQRQEFGGSRSGGPFRLADLRP